MKKKINIKDLSHESVILNFFRALTVLITGAFKKSIFGYVCVSDGSLEKDFKKGAVAGVLNGQTRRNSLIKKIRRFIAGGFERSRVLLLIKRIYAQLLGMQIRTLGLFMMSFAIFSFFAALIGLLSGSVYNFLNDIILILSVAGIALPLVFTRKSIVKQVSESRFIGHIFSRALGVDMEKIKRETVTDEDNGRFSAYALILGIVLGTLTVFVRPHVFLLTVLFSFAVLFILSKPEAGVVAFIAFIPFGELCVQNGADVSLILVLVTLLAYLGKLIRGKRGFHIGLIDVLMMLVAVVALFSCFGRAAESAYHEVRRVFVFIIEYFLFVNLIKNRSWLKRVRNAFIFAFVSITFMSVMVPMLSEMPLLSGLLSGINGLDKMFVFGTPSSAVFCLIPVIPFMLAGIKNSPSSKRIAYAMCITIIAACVLVGGGFFALTSFLATVIVYSLCTAPSLVFLLIPAGLIYFLIAGLDIPFVSDTVAKAYAYAENLSLEKFYVSKGAFRALGDHLFTGIGFGDGAFSGIYPNYAYAGFENATSSGNSMLDLLLGLGVFGTAVVLILLLFFFRESFGNVLRISNAKDKGYVSAAIASLFGFAFASVTDSVFETSTVFMMVMTLIAFTVSYIGICDVESERAQIRHPDTPDKVDMRIPYKPSHRKNPKFK